ncbi:CoA transferase [Allopusillimonas ginsengisoli]|nr:CoA transferase [Allopusillimonas ginsengisoli]
MNTLIPTPPAPLSGTTIIELAAIGPVPFATRILQQMGAKVIVVDSPNDRGLGIPIAPQHHYLRHDKQSVCIDLKSQAGREELFELISTADAIVEGFRPGTLERLGLSPDVLHALTPMLIIGRCDGWGNKSPRRLDAGHDINYLALSGVLSTIGTEQPIPPINLIGDFGGAGMHLATGLLAALIRRYKEGCGTVVETSIFEGTTSLMTMIYGLADAGQWESQRSSNILDGGAPYYQCYETADQQWMAVGAIEQKFFRMFIHAIGADIDIDRQLDREYWPIMQQEIAARMKSRTRDEWDALFVNTDCCCTPVLTMDEARGPCGAPTFFNNGIPVPPITFT